MPIQCLLPKVQTVSAFCDYAARTRALRRIFLLGDVVPSKWAVRRRGGSMTFRSGQDGDGPGPMGGGSFRHRPLEVTVGERGIEGALRLFKKLVLRDGILRDLKRRAHHEKPGDRRRRKAREAARRLRKRLGRAQARGEQID